MECVATVLQRVYWRLRGVISGWRIKRVLSRFVRRGSAIHNLKTWPHYYRASAIGIKGFEIRKNDRDYRPGDVLVLYEYDPDNQRYTGEVSSYVVTYILYGPPFGVEADYCVMSTKRIG